jgi:hypothetical protein
MTNNPQFVSDTNVLISVFLFSQSKLRQALDQAQDIGKIYKINKLDSRLLREVGNLKILSIDY